MPDRFTSPFIFDADHHGRALTRIEFGTPPFTEPEIQEILRLHPELLAIDQIDSLFSPAVCIGREVRAGKGYIDNLYISPSGFITIVETKLWRNPQARREVVAQILEYAKELTQWTHAQLDNVVEDYAKEFKLQKLESLAAFVADRTDEEIEEQQFADAVARCLRGGKFLLLIVGEGIRENAEDLIAYLSQTPGLGYNLSLVELSCYRLDSKELLLIPRTVAQSKEIERAVVMIELAPAAAHVRVKVEPPVVQQHGGKRSSLSEGEFNRGLREALRNNVSPRFFTFLDDLQKLGIHRDYKRANVSLRYEPKREDSETLSVLSVSKDAFLWAGFWLANQLNKSHVSDELAERFWQKLAEIDARFAPCDKKDRKNFVPIPDIVDRLPEIVSAVDELLKAVETAPAR